MAYMEQLHSGLESLVAAAEAGRRSADEMLGPMNGAISDIAGAASELENMPFVGPVLGAKLQRTMRSISAAQSVVGEVAAKYSQVVTAAAQIQQLLARTSGDDKPVLVIHREPGCPVEHSYARESESNTVDIYS